MYEYRSKFKTHVHCIGKNKRNSFIINEIIIVFNSKNLQNMKYCDFDKYKV